MSTTSSLSFFDQPGWTSGVFNGSKYRYFYHKASESKPTFLLTHGFPSGPYTWRSLMPLMQKEGYGLVVPELIGYGESDKASPDSLAKLERKKMCDDLAAMLDHEKVDKVIVFGHDHGSPVAGAFARFQKDRTIALILACLSYSPPDPSGTNIGAFLEYWTPILGYENFGYWKTFLSPHAPKLVEDHLDSFISIMYAEEPEIWRTHLCPTGALEQSLRESFKPPFASWASPELEAEMRQYLVQTGMTGPLAWYYAATDSTVNFESESAAPTKKIEVPYLFIATTRDQACPPVIATGQEKWCDDLTVKEIARGHWVCESEPQVVLDSVHEWMTAKGLNM